MSALQTLAPLWLAAFVPAFADLVEQADLEGEFLPKD
jgi:hypothetical protein